MPNALQELHPDSLWVASIPHRFFGLEMGARMTVVRLSDNSLLILCPIDLSPTLRDELEALGAVRAVVAPNRFHHLCVAEYARAFPHAKVFIAPGLKLKDVEISGVLGEQPEPLWRDVLDQTMFRGNTLEQEAVFFHRLSRTLIVTDLCFNVRRFDSALQRMMARLNGLDDFGPSRLSRLTTRDREAARASLQRVLQWDFERVVVAHGDVMESGGKAALQSAFDWL